MCGLLVAGVVFLVRTLCVWTFGLFLLAWTRLHLLHRLYERNRGSRLWWHFPMLAWLVRSVSCKSAMRSGMVSIAVCGTNTYKFICRMLYFCVFSILLSLTSDQRYTHLASDWHCTWEVWTTDLCDAAAAVRSAAPCLKGSWDDANSQNSTNTKGYWTDHESGLFGSFPTPRSQPNTSQTWPEFRGKWSLVNGNMYRLLILDILINRVYLFCVLFTNSLTWSNRGIFENLLTIELILIASFSLEFM